VQKDHVARATPGAKEPFRQRSGIGIILQMHQHAKFLMKASDNWNAIPARQIGRRKNQPFPGAQCPPTTDADSFDALALGKPANCLLDAL